MDKVTPYHHFSYEEQISKKSEWLQNSVLKEFTAHLKKQIKDDKEICPAWFRDVYLAQELEPVCPLKYVIQCPPENIEGYRNKVEFTIGRRFGGFKDDTDEEVLGKVCIGFNIGNLAKGIIFTEPPEDVKVISKESLIVRDMAQKLIEDSMWKYDHVGPYDKRINKGFWRILLYRESKITKEVLISFVVSEENDLKEDEL